MLQPGGGKATRPQKNGADGSARLGKTLRRMIGNVSSQSKQPKHAALFYLSVMHEVVELRQTKALRPEYASRMGYWTHPEQDPMLSQDAGMVLPLTMSAGGHFHSTTSRDVSSKNNSGARMR